MQLTKYPQSCVVIEASGARLLVDPGSFAADAYPAAAFGRVDAVLWTHRHPDHFDPRLIEPFAEQGAQFVANADVASLLFDHEVTRVGDGQAIEVAGVPVVAHDLPHVTMVDGSPGPPNTGFVFDGRLLHPGDAVETSLAVTDLALPIAGPSVSFRRSYQMVESTGARTVVPIHYDSFIADPAFFAQFCDIARVVPLAAGESLELPD